MSPRIPRSKRYWRRAVHLAAWRDPQHSARLDSALVADDSSNVLSDDRLPRTQASLQEQIAFLEEQMHSTRLYLAEFVLPELVILRAQSEELLHDISVMSLELHERERVSRMADLESPHAATSRTAAFRADDPGAADRTTLKLYRPRGADTDTPTDG